MIRSQKDDFKVSGLLEPFTEMKSDKGKGLVMREKAIDSCNDAETLFFETLPKRWRLIPQLS